MSNTKLTVKEMTARYNEMAAELDLPIVKKLKPTKEFDTVKARYDAMRHTYNMKFARYPEDPKSLETPKPANRTPITVPTPKAETAKVEKATEAALEKNRDDAKADMNKTRKAAAEQFGIKSTRPGTSIHLLIECVITGGTVSELYHMMDGLWTENTIRAALAWDIPKKGYKVESRMTTVDGKDMLFYRISNAQVVV